MDSHHVTAEQARAITRWVDPTVQRLMQLQRRMDERGFPQTDKLYVRVAVAREALANLTARSAPTTTRVTTRGPWGLSGLDRREGAPLSGRTNLAGTSVIIPACGPHLSPKPLLAHPRDDPRPSGIWAWERYDQHRQEQAERAAAEHVEQLRVNEIVRRRGADSKDLLFEVKRKLVAGEDREAVKAWAERRQREIQAEAQREIDGK